MDISQNDALSDVSADKAPPLVSAQSESMSWMGDALTVPIFSGSDSGKSQIECFTHSRKTLEQLQVIAPIADDRWSSFEFLFRQVEARWQKPEGSPDPSVLMEQAAVLAFDLVDSTTFLENVERGGGSPVHAINKLFHPLIDAIRAHSGIVVDISGETVVRGDAVIGVFLGELSAWSALNAALSVQSKWAALTRDGMITGKGGETRLRAGISFGPIERESITTAQAGRGSLIGSTVNRAFHAATGKSHGESLPLEVEAVTIYLDPSCRRELGSFSSCQSALLVPELRGSQA